MNADFEIEFKSPEHARKALKILKTKEFSGKVSLALSLHGSNLHVKIRSGSFAALRARATSLLRDLKIVFDAIALTERK